MMMVVQSIAMIKVTVGVTIIMTMIIISTTASRRNGDIDTNPYCHYVNYPPPHYYHPSY